MKDGKMLVCQVICLVLSIVLLSGCKSKQDASCQQEKERLQGIVKDQQSKIDEQETNIEMMAELFTETTNKLDKCEKRLAKLVKEKKMAEKLNRFAPGELEQKLAELKEQKQQAAQRLMQEKAAGETNEPGAGQAE
jgi:outer membrane murein-binding lipoprotein Lpp